MKKVALSVLSVVLVLVMTLSLSACGSEKDKFVGTWKGDIEIGKLLNKSLAEENSEMAEYFDFDGFKIAATFTFTKEGTASFKVDKEAFENSLREVFKKGFNNYFTDLIASSGLSGFTADDLLKQQGTTMDEIIDQAMEEKFNLEESFKELEKDGQYDVKDGKLYTFDKGSELNEDEYDTYEIKGSQLTLLKTYGKDADVYNLLYPVVLNKQ